MKIAIFIICAMLGFSAPASADMPPIGADLPITVPPCHALEYEGASMLMAEQMNMPWSGTAERVKADTGTEWRTDLNEAAQHFEICITDYYGTQRSALCQTIQQEVIKNELEWDTP